MDKKCVGPGCPGCDATGCYAKGGSVDDMDSMLDQCASECMSAIEGKDPKAFRQSLDALVSDICMRLMEEPSDVDGT